MPKTIDKAKRVVDSLSSGCSVNEIKSIETTDDQDWQRVSAKAYELHLRNSRKQRVEDEKNLMLYVLQMMK